MTADGLPFTQVPEWVRFAPISAPALRLYEALLDHVDPDRARRGDTWVWPSLDALALVCRFGARQRLTRYVRELSEAGLIEIASVPFASGRKNFYRVALRPPAGWGEPTSWREFYAWHRTDEPEGGTRERSPLDALHRHLADRDAGGGTRERSSGGTRERAQGGTRERAVTRSTELDQSELERTAVSDGRTASRAPVTDEPSEPEPDGGHLADVETADAVSPEPVVGSTPGQDEASADVRTAVAGRRSVRVRLHPPTDRECALPRREQQGIAMARLHKGLAAAGYLLLDRDAGVMPGADWRDRGGSELARVIGRKLDEHGLRRAVEAAERWANDQIEDGSPWIVPIGEAAS